MSDTPQTQKNIVFIMADQLAAAFLNCYGGQVDSTPTLDRLAAEGVRFDRCYATHPVCAPNRATILTGRSSSVHGIISNNYTLSSDNTTYAQVLRAHGYRTGGFGKFHQTPMHFPVPDSLGDLGFDEAVVTEDPKWPWLDWVQAEHPEYYEQALAMCWNWPTHPPDPRREARDKIRSNVMGPVLEKAPWRLAHPSPIPPEVHDTTYITDLGLDFIERHAAVHADQPFFCHISYVDPHDPYDPPEPYASMFSPDEMEDPLPAEWLEQGYRTLERARQEFPGFPDVSDDLEAMRQTRALYHGSLRFLDHQIARVVDFLEQSGLWENTVLGFSTDHGDMLGDHQLITKGVKPYDTGIRVPLIVAGGGTVAEESERLTCTLDFYPTFCDWAGVEEGRRPPLEGRSLAPICAGQSDPDPWPEVLVSFGGVQTVISDDGWRLTRFPDDDKGQLFSLVEDPGEQLNLYDDPAHAEVRQRLLEQLVRAMGRPGHVPHYRNMPVCEGTKRRPVGAKFLGEIPVYR